MEDSPETAAPNRLREERLRRNLRQSDVAELLGTTVVTVRRWEQGTQHPHAYFRLKLCTLFGKSAEELGLVVPNPSPPNTSAMDASPTVQTSSARTDTMALWTVPFARNRYFTGRDDLLEQVDRLLSPRTVADPSPTTRRVALTQAQAIKGLGGIGKTQIAAEYAYRSRERGRYTHILWIDAANEETLMASFGMLADLLPDFPAKNETDQRKLVTAIKRWLEQCPQRWLLIFDNVEDLPLVQEQCPHIGNGSLLFTTRMSATGALASSIEVETMGLLEGTSLLLHRAQRQDASDEERNDAINVVIALDGFPLALDQAGAYIEETGCSFGDYLRLYQGHRTALLTRRGTQTTSYPDSVATTWSLSFQRVEQSNPAAAELLCLCAFLAPDHIPEELLTEGAEHWPAALQQATIHRFAFNNLIEDLLRFSLVKRLLDQQLVSIHRLVQAVQLDALNAEEQQHWAERVVRAVNGLFPHAPKEDITSWPQCQRYLEQVQTCDHLIQQYQLLFPEAADVLHRAGIYLYERGLYSHAELLYQRALHIWEQQGSAERLQMTTPLTNLANLYRNQGKLEQAKVLYQRALHLQEEEFGPNHPKMASILGNLALLYGDLGNYEQAGSLFQQVLHIREQELGGDHPSIAFPLNNLAIQYLKQGNYKQAELVCQRALSIREQALGYDHPYVAFPLHNLAVISRLQGRYEQAELLFQRALRIREQKLGPDHPDTASSLNGLAHLYSGQGKDERAEVLFQQAYHIWTQSLGLDHPLVANALSGLATLYLKQSNYAEAELLLQRALHIQEQSQGLDHPDTAEVLDDLARLREAQGQYEEAKAQYVHALSVYQQKLGMHHPQTRETRRRLIALLHTLEQHEAAAQLETTQAEP